MTSGAARRMEEEKGGEMSCIYFNEEGGGYPFVHTYLPIYLPNLLC